MRTSVRSPIAAALVLLDDEDAVGGASFGWFRRGKTGTLHGRRTCYRVRDPYLLTSVRLPLRDAAAGRVCAVCFDTVFSSPVLDEALALAVLRENLDAARAGLEDGSPSRVSAAWDLVRGALDSLEEMGYGTACRKANAELRSEAADLWREVQLLMGNSGEEVVRRAASDIAAVLVGRTGAEPVRYRQEGAPGISVELSARCGSHGRAALRQMYSLWRELVEQGGSAEEANAAAVEFLVSEVELLEARQLSGVLLGPAAVGADAYASGLEAWSRQLREEAQAVVARWSEWFEEALADRDWVTVGVPSRWVRDLGDDDVTGALRSFRHVVRPHGVVGTYPAVVWWWLRGREGDRVQRSDVVAQEQAVLDTACALWEPRGGGTYSQLSAAMAAASALVS